jgi:DNA-directed RNA polymerase subunit alpha
MDLKKKGFQLPEKIRFEEETLSDTYGKLIAEPLERGYGASIGNSLRRILLSSIEGAAVTGVKLSGALHEFSTIKGVTEDVTDIILNIKSISFGMDGAGSKTAVVKSKGPGAVTGGDLQVDASVKVLNPEQVIATLDRGAVFDAEFYLGKGKGYVPSEMNKSEEQSVDVIAVDSDYNPVRKVNFSVEKARVGRSTDYDRLILEIWTNGAVSPVRAVSQAAGMLAEHMTFFIFEREEEAQEPEQAVIARTDDLVFNENLMKTVDELELSVRAHNCLKNADIRTIADLVQRSEYDMLRTKNFGRKSLNEIKEILGSMGLHFGMRIDMEMLEKEEEEVDEA